MSSFTFRGGHQFLSLPFSPLRWPPSARSPCPPSSPRCHLWRARAPILQSGYFSRNRNTSTLARPAAAADVAAIVHMKSVFGPSVPVSQPCPNPPPHDVQDCQQSAERWSLELQTNLREDYAKFYNHREGPTRALFWFKVPTRLRH